jgi:hypothetical protein
MKAAKVKAGCGAAVVIVFTCILFFGSAVEDAARSAAVCMESANDLLECSRVDGAELWERVAAVAVLGFLVGVVCFIYGQSYRPKP